MGPGVRQNSLNNRMNSENNSYEKCKNLLVELFEIIDREESLNNKI